METIKKSIGIPASIVAAENISFNDIEALLGATTVQEAVDILTRIVKGRNRAHVFATTQSMQAWLSDTANKNVCGKGDNLYIVDLGVPDWWISDVLDEADPETGYFYKIAQLETQKVDLTEIESWLNNLNMRVGSLETGLGMVKDRVAALELPDIVETTSYTCLDSAPGGYRLLEMLGNTEQKKLTGKNLASVADMTSETKEGITKSISNGVITASGTATGDNADIVVAFNPPMVLEGGVEYNISFPNFVGVPYEGAVVVHFWDDATQTYVFYTQFHMTESATFTPPWTLSACGHILIRPSRSQSINASFRIQLEEGTEATDYEPYCGGVPSPNPSYPQAMMSTGECAGMVQGRYIPNSGIYENTTFSVCNKHKIPCESGDKIQFLLENIGNVYVIFYNENGYMNYGLLIDDGKNGEITAPSGVTHFNFDVTREIITPETAGKITLTINGKYLGCAKTVSDNLWDEQWEIGAIDLATGLNLDGYPQIRSKNFIKVKPNETVYIYNDSITTGKDFTPNGYWIGYDERQNRIRYSGNSYEYAMSNGSFVVPPNCHYIKFYCNADYGTTYLGNIRINYETIAYILTDEPLRKGDILFKDRDGLWKVERATVEQEFNGDEDIHVYTFPGENVERFYAHVGRPCIAGGYSACSHFTYRDADPDEPHFRWSTSGGGVNDQIYMCIPKTIANTVDEFKTWLASNPVKAQWQVNPFYEVLDAESQRQLNALETFAGATYVEVDSRVQPAGIRGEYATTKSAGYSLKALNNSESYLASL